MDANNGVLDISSDEEPDVNDEVVNLEWLCDQLFKDVDDSDDVVVVREVFSSKKVEGDCLKNHVAACNVVEKKQQAEEEEADDDCVVLDGDPDKMVSVEESQDDESDELVVVGEKGQVACRDYPHPRHLCVKYPFSSTLHKFHCEQCHCYVCDTVAPCILWGTGMSIVDHCHATDKLEAWKTERKNFKLKRCSSLPSLKMSENPSSLPPSTVSTQIPSQSHHLTRSITMPSNHVALRSMPSVPAVRSVLSPPEFRPIPLPSTSVVRPLPSAPNSPVSNVTSPRSGLLRFPQSSALQQLPGVYSKYVGQGGRCQNVTSLGPQHVPFKRTRGSEAYRAAHLSGFGRPYPAANSYVPSTARNQPLGRESLSIDCPPHQLMNMRGDMYTRTVQNPSPQSHYVNMPHTAAVYEDVTSKQPSTMSAQNAKQQVAYPTDMTTLSDVSLPWVDCTSSISTQWTQPQLAEIAPHCNASNIWTDNAKANSGQLDHLQRAEVSTPNTSTPWAGSSNCSQSDQHHQPNALEFQGPQSMNVASNRLRDDQSRKGPLLAPGSDDPASAVPELENLHFEFEDWLMGNQPAVGSIEPPFFSDQNILSPDDAHIDSVLLFEDEWSAMGDVAGM